MLKKYKIDILVNEKNNVPPTVCISIICNLFSAFQRSLTFEHTILRG